MNSLANRPDGKLILVTAISPTPAGEGKTTTTVGLGDALNRIGKKASICLREPSLGPVFGMKGGAAGGGYAQVAPMEDINLHFTGDFHAIALANNLLAAMIDNHIHHGNELRFDLRRIMWKRVVDMNDRALREITVGLGGPSNGFPRQDRFDIVVASEVMAIFCLATSLKGLKDRLGNIIVGYTREQKPIHARELKAHGAMAVLLKDALKPNLAQTLENTPAFIHGGPFANIAHGCNSVLATTTALKLTDYVVTEAGFGADLGAEKSKYLPRVGEAFEGFEELPTFPGLYYIRLLVAAREFARSGIVRAFTALQKAGEEAQRLTDYAESFRIENDLVPVPLWEGDCTTRLETLADIPRGKAVYWFERTDLVKAKEVLGDVVCLRGNVPASMLTTGTPEQVDAYCRMLIEKVGKGGGFILDGAIGIPDESKPENVTAMFEAARKYTP